MSAPQFGIINTAPPHSTAATPVAPSPVPGAGGSPTPPASTGSGGSSSTFWPWALAYVLFWFIVVALHEYGGANAQTIGSGFALLVLTTVLLTQGGKAMSNAVALFTNA